MLSRKKNMPLIFILRKILALPGNTCFRLGSPSVEKRRDLSHLRITAATDDT